MSDAEIVRHAQEISYTARYVLNSLEIRQALEMYCRLHAESTYQTALADVREGVIGVPHQIGKGNIRID